MRNLSFCEPINLNGPTLGALVILFLAGCARIHPPQGRTSLSDRSAKYEVVKQSSVTVELPIDGKQMMKAVLAGNEAVGAAHREGYNGLIEIRYGDGESPMVPTYAGLNLEHVLNGRAHKDRDLQFEPRRHPMEIRRIGDRTFELYQPALPVSGLESCTRFEFKSPHYVDVTFECIPRKDDFPFGYLNIFWASYILQPGDMSIYFKGRAKGEAGERWIKGVTPKHGVLATHRGAKDLREYDYEKPFPLTLVFNESDWVYTLPAYYGRYGNYAWMVLFDERDGVRLTQSPSGGGERNPAWDFQWFIDKPRKDEFYRLSYRLVFKPWKNQEDLLEEYEKYRRGK